MSAAADSCTDPGEKVLRPGEPCMPARLIVYLYCLEKSGGGKVEFTSKITTDTTSEAQISVGGKASGIIIKSEASGRVSKTESAKVTSELQEKLDPTLGANCKFYANASIKIPQTVSSTLPEPPWPENLKQYAGAFALLHLTGHDQSTNKAITFNSGGVVIAPGVIFTAAAPVYKITGNAASSMVARFLLNDGSLSAVTPVEYSGVLQGSSFYAIVKTKNNLSTKSFIPKISEVAKAQGLTPTLSFNREIVVFLPDYERATFHVTYGRVTDEVNLNCDVNLPASADGAPVFTKDTGQFVGLLVRGDAQAVLGAYERNNIPYSTDLDFSGSSHIVSTGDVRADVANNWRPMRPPPPVFR